MPCCSRKPSSAPHEGVEGTVADVLGGVAVSGQVDRVDGRAGRQRFLHEEPGVLVAAVTVYEQHGLLCGAEGRVGDRAAVHLHCPEGGSGDLVDRSGVQFLPRSARGLLDQILRHVGRSDQRDRAADGDVLVRLGDDPPHDPRPRRLQRPGDLVGVDVGQVVALGHLVALGHEPGGDLATLHRQAPLGHGDLRDGVFGAHRIRHFFQSMVFLTALATFCASGM